MTTMEKPIQRTKSLAVMFLLGATLAGGALGFSADRMMSRGRSGTKDRISGRDQLSADLSLTPGQRAAVDSILDDRHRQFAEAMKPIRPRLDSIRLNARAQIMNHLDASQQAKFRHMLEEMEQKEKEKEKAAKAATSR